MNRYEKIAAMVAELDNMPPSTHNNRLNAARDCLRQALEYIDEQNAKIEALLAVCAKFTIDKNDNNVL